MKRILLAFLLLVCMVLVGCQCKHNWLEVSRTEPGCAENGVVRFACSECDETNEEVIPATGKHIWVDASCDAPKHCNQCGMEDGEAIGHSWVDATCVTPKVCRVCAAIESEALGHSVTQGLCERCKYVVTPYGLLAEKDARIFYRVISVIDRFKNPASVRIMDVDHYYYKDEDSDCSLTISAQNSFGATSSKSYYITSDGKIYESDIYRSSSSQGYDLTSINNAIQEYCKDKGWI